MYTYDIHKLYVLQCPSVQIWNYCEMLVIRSIKVNFMGHAGLYYIRLTVSAVTTKPNLLISWSNNWRNGLQRIFFSKGPDNFFLNMKEMLDATASDAFAARSCKMEWQRTSGEQCEPVGRDPMYITPELRCKEKTSSLVSTGSAYSIQSIIFNDIPTDLT